MRYLALLMILCSVATSAYAANVSFTASWTAPTADIEGNPATPDDYMLYVCDQPITSQYQAPMPDGVLVGACAGTMQTYVVTTTQTTGNYTTTLLTGTAYARVTARRNVTVDGVPKVIESDLSNQATRVWNLGVPPQAPLNFTISP